MITQTVTVKEKDSQNIVIGRRGTYETEQIVFNVQYLIDTYGDGTAVLLVKRSADTSAYPATTVADGNKITWTVNETDTSYKGHGEIELFWYVNNGLAKSVIYDMTVLRDIGETTQEPPDPYESWIDDLTELGAQTQQYAQDAQEAAAAVLGMRATAETLEPGSQATASYEGGVLTLGIPQGEKGDDGEDGTAATVSVGTTSTGNPGTNAEVSNSGTQYAAVLNFKIPRGAQGVPGEDGADGEDGYSPTVTVTEISGGHEVTITDVNGDHTFDVMDGTGGSGGTSDYADLTNKPSIEGVTLSGNKTAADLGLAKASDIPTVPVQSVNSKTGVVVLTASDVGAGTYSKPSGGIPKTDLASAVQTSLGKADTALQSAPVISVNGQTGAVTVSVPSAETNNPAALGTASPGSSNDYARGDHVHPLPLKYTTLTIAATDWSSLSCTKTVTGMTSTAIVWLEYSDTTTAFTCTQGADSLTFGCDATPSAAVTVKVAFMEGISL